ncbi:hypothetical protein [Lysinibacillus sp. FW12]|uniref:hypothetical protein n=1 Tax=Lysinibacillus sp. FW12 TaxID=3096079 RepID=UPI003D72139B
MSEKYPLQETLSPIDKKGRDRLNENWTRIMAYFDHVQLQIKALAGGHEVDELIARLEQAIENAESDLQKYIAQVDTTVQEAIDANNTATQDAINANNTALQTALQTVSNKLTELNTAISNAETATSDANVAKNAAIQATQDAQNAINTMKSLIDNFGSKGTWSSTTQFYKNNLAEVDGRTYIALKDNINTPVTDKSTWALFADKGATGATGPQGLPGKDGKDGTGVNIIGELSSEDELPTVGAPGDAYMIHGDLYVWQENTNTWKNVGPIRGPEGKSAYTIAVENGFVGTMEEWLKSLKGETGPPGPDGPQGPPGKDADLTEVNQQIAEIKKTADNSWQRNKENNVTVSNMGNFTAEKILMINQADWKNTGNVEQLDIGIPVEGGFSGLIRVTYTSFWGGSDSHGGATVLYRIGNYLAPTSATRLNDCVVETITPDFAKDFYIHKAVANTENGNIALLISRSPVANNPLVVKIELQGYNSGSKRAFQILNSIVVNTIDMGSPTANGYPWTPQTSRIPTGADFSNWNSTAHRLQPKCAVVSDWNMVKDNGFYMGEPVAQNAPTKEWWMGFVVAHNDSYVVQKLINVTGGSEFERQCYNGVWENWIETSPRKLFQSVSNGKATVNQAVTDMGVYTPPDATFATTAANIRLIPKGRKEAKGVAYASNVSGRARIIVTGLSFHPTAILITKENNNNNEFKSIYAPSDVFFDNNSNAYMNFFTYNENGSILIASPALVSNYQGFEMNVSMTYNSRSEGIYRWFAFG